MKVRKKTFTMFFIIAILFGGCIWLLADNGEETTELAEPIGDDACELLSDNREEAIIENEKYYKIIDAGEGRYLYTIYNTDGEAVKSGETYRMGPGIHYIDQKTIEISISAGTGTFFCVYYDIVNDRFSEQYECPIEAKYNKVAFLNHTDGKTVLIIKDMFNDGNCYKEYDLDFSFAVSPVLHAEFIDEDTLLITYQSGDSYEKKIKVLFYGESGETDDIKEISVCEIVRAMDFTVKEPDLDITPEENQIYLEGYLKVLKNEIPITSGAGEQYYKDLWKAGTAFEELVKEKGTREYPYLYYYDDLDGDGKPELAINQGCMFLLKYEPDLNQCRILYDLPTYYFEKIVGVGQIWYHDGFYGRDRLITLNDEGSFQGILWLEEGKYGTSYFEVGAKDDSFHYADVSEEEWNEITKPFFEMVENNGLPLKTLEEVFGDLLEENTGE